MLCYAAQALMAWCLDAVAVFAMGWAANCSCLLFAEFMLAV